MWLSTYWILLCCQMLDLSSCTIKPKTIQSLRNLSSLKSLILYNVLPVGFDLSDYVSTLTCLERLRCCDSCFQLITNRNQSSNQINQSNLPVKSTNQIYQSNQPIKFTNQINQSNYQLNQPIEFTNQINQSDQPTLIRSLLILTLSYYEWEDVICDKELNFLFFI